MAEVWQRLIQVLSEPIRAFRAFRERPLVIWALIIVVVSEIAMNLLIIEPDPSGMLGFQDRAAVPETSAVQKVLSPLVTIGVFWVGTLIFQAIARALGGTGSHRALVGAMGFASLPGILQAPTFLVARAVGAVSLAALGQIVFAVWMIVLNVLAIREVHQISTGRTIVTFIAGILAVVVIVFVVAVLFGLLLVPLSG